MATNRNTSGSSETSTDTVAMLLEAVVIRLGNAGDGDDPVARLQAVADVAKASPWRSYRAGRVRLAGLAGMYWMWLVPRLDHVFVADETSICWRTAAGVLAEVAVCDLDIDDDTVTSRAADEATRCQQQFGGEFAGVRVLDLSRPTASVFITAAGTSLPISETAFCLNQEPSNV